MEREKKERRSEGKERMSEQLQRCYIGQESGNGLGTEKRFSETEKQYCNGAPIYNISYLLKRRENSGLF